ncbi:MAG: hypothetical protein AB2809_00530 [Candidatus Thiodiazotropha sp.]
MDNINSNRSEWGRDLNSLLLRRAGKSWSSFFGGLLSLYKDKNEAVLALLEACESNKHHSTTFHSLTVIGMGCKYLVDSLGFDEYQAIFDDASDPKPELLNSFLKENLERVTELVINGNNSFTSARRFILPQILFSRFFSQKSVSVNFADLGTGGGALPKELNNKVLYDKYNKDLIWPGKATYPFMPLNLEKAYGIEKNFNAAWVRSCFANSNYYDQLYSDFQDANNSSHDHEVNYVELDALESTALSDFLTQNRINAITCNFMLYQYKNTYKKKIIDAVLSNLSAPYIFLIVDPFEDYAVPGCSVGMYVSEHMEYLNFARISDSHYKGDITPDSDYYLFAGKYL